MQQNWLKHALARTGWRPQTQIAVMAVLGALLTLVFGGVYLSQVASYTAVSREIADLIEERDRLEFTNEQLRAEIAGLKTVPRLLTRAEELGFVPASPDRIRYLVIDGYNPDRERTVVPAPLEEEFMDDQPVYDETFSGWLAQTFDDLSRQFQGFGS